MSNINVCFSCDDNYAKYAGVAIASILSNASSEEALVFFILDGGISEINKQQILQLKSIKDCEIKFIQINENDFSDYKCVGTHNYISMATYYRLKLSSLLPQIDKIIYFDCDMVVNSSLSELYNVNLDDYLIAGVKDINKRMLKSNPTYINAGMIVFNLKKFREQCLEKKFLDWTIHNIDKIKVGDQTIINEVCRGQIKLVDDSWNVQSSNFTNRSSYTQNPKVIHYVAKKKPWGGKSFSYHKNLYFKYLQMTPWKLGDEELKHYLKSTAIDYIKYRPFFILRPRFYVAFFETYIKPLFVKGDRL